MLNPTFSKHDNASIRTPFVLPSEFAHRTIEGNASFDTGREYRLQPVYGDEVWSKLSRAGFTPNILAEKSILEVCAGTGFLTHHLLSRCAPKSLTVNDISEHEINAARILMATHHPDIAIDWALGDMHEMNFKRTFDIILGNSFIHHFHNVPEVLSRIADLLDEGGVFISMHEPTPMAAVVESAKLSAFPLAVLAPNFVNDIARNRYQGEPSGTDIWQFEPRILRRVAIQSGFSKVIVFPWNLFRPIIVQKNNLHLSETHPTLSKAEEQKLAKAVNIDAILNRLLPTRFFGAICVVCYK